MTLGARRSRVLGAIWILAGLGLLAGAVLLWVDRQTVSVWELPLAVVALGVGAWLWSQRVTIDRDGITVSSLRGTDRTLWTSIDGVEVQATWWRPALTIHRQGNVSSTSVRSSSGLTSSQRARLFDVLYELSRDHGFTIRRSGAPDVASAADLPAGGAAAGLALVEPDVRSTGEGAAEDTAEGAPADDGVSSEGVPTDDDRADGAPVEDTPSDAATPEAAPATPDAAPDGIDPDATDVIEVIVKPAGHDTSTPPPTS